MNDEAIVSFIEVVVESMDEIKYDTGTTPTETNDSGNNSSNDNVNVEHC